MPDSLVSLDGSVSALGHGFNSRPGRVLYETDNVRLSAVPSIKLLLKKW
jgi:hypothetical protein